NFNKETPSSLPAQAGFAVPTRHSAGSPVKESPLTSRKGLNLTEFGKLKWHYHPTDKSRPPYVMLVPLQEIISEAVDVGVASKKVQGIYEDMIIKLGNEFDILMKVKINEVEKVAGERVAEALRKVRIGDIVIQPGYDGEFGVVKIWSSDVDTVKKKVNIVDQKTLF
ncbi:MAG: hypothetical protein U9Q63_01625, partial [Patescibacteria group bacterium]|nr:hypothetical protein [Patescibacteria group bacterium]